jgi:hypothetical protein
VSFFAELFLSADSSGGRHTDWWAFGVFAYELFTGCSPWFNMRVPRETVTEILYREIHLPRTFSSEARLLIDSITKDYKIRLGTEEDEEIERAPFFKSIDWNKLAKLELPGAIFPRASCTEDRDREEAMKAFTSLMCSLPSPGMMNFTLPPELELDHMTIETETETTKKKSKNKEYFVCHLQRSSTSYTGHQWCFDETTTTMDSGSSRSSGSGSDNGSSSNCSNCPSIDRINSIAPIVLSRRSSSTNIFDEDGKKGNDDDAVSCR